MSFGPLKVFEIGLGRDSALGPTSSFSPVSVGRQVDVGKPKVRKAVQCKWLVDETFLPPSIPPLVAYLKQGTHPEQCES